MTRREAELLCKKKVTRKLIEELFTAPPPPGRPPAVRLKPSRCVAGSVASCPPLPGQAQGARPHSPSGRPAQGLSFTREPGLQAVKARPAISFITGCFSWELPVALGLCIAHLKQGA